MTEFSLRMGFAILTGLAITAGFVLFVWECVGHPRPWSEHLLKNVKLSVSALGPNVLMFLLVAPWWAFVYLQTADIAPVNMQLGLVPIVGAFLACDFSYYIEHRCGHKIRLLWRLHHGAHHHSDLYNIPLAYRVSFLTQLTTPVFYIPWLFLGFHPLLIIGFQVFVLHYQAWIHTESVGRLGLLDRYFNTPAIHRMHHSRDPAHRDVNLGGVTLIWDHLFNSYCAPEDDLEYGVAGAPASTAYSGIYLDPWRER